MEEETKMFIVIEIDKHFTVGVDWLKQCKGIRLGFIAIHFVFVGFDKLVDSFLSK